MSSGDVRGHRGTTAQVAPTPGERERWAPGPAGDEPGRWGRGRAAHATWAGIERRTPCPAERNVGARCARSPGRSAAYSSTRAAARPYQVDLERWTPCQ